MPYRKIQLAFYSFRDYTDVYKRQVLKRLGTLKEYAESWGNHYAVPMPKTPKEKQQEKERWARMGPVSYTHLDVYKRQSGYCGLQLVRKQCGVLNL